MKELAATLFLALATVGVLFAVGTLAAILWELRPGAPPTPPEPPDPDEERAARVVRLTVAAAQVWPDAYVIVNESGARVLGAGGSLLAFGSSLEELEDVVRGKLAREATA